MTLRGLIAIAVGVLGAAGWPTGALADAGAARREHGPCSECLASLPAGTDPRPLLVLLHGDGESAASILALWERAAAPRGIVVFAPACPRSEGCTGQSWWKWDGDPSWLLRQIDALAQLRAIDRERMWLAGWSGGGTYIGWNTQELERTFAALVIHGGGVRPKDPRCSEPKAAVYFLGGNGNPYHYLAEELHDYYVRCAHDDTTWTVVKGADHGGEREALVSRREAILDWLVPKRRALRVNADPLDAGSSDGASDASLSPFEPGSSPAPPPPPAAPQPPASRSSCRCLSAGAASVGDESPMAASALLVALLATAARRRSGRA